MSDGIEIHFDPKRGRLELSCEPDAFVAYREITRKQLAGFPEVQLDHIYEINVVDAKIYTARNGKHQSVLRTILLGAAVAAVGSLAILGAFVLIGRIAA